MKYKKYIILLLVVARSACKTQKNVSDAGINTIATKKIISNHYSNSFNQKTISAKGKKASASVSVRLRLEKDKTIWLSASKFGIPLAKVKITPTRVSYYEKLSKTYFDGDFTLLSNWLGTELDYEKVQNILLGQAVMNLRKGKYISSIENNLYEVKPKRAIKKKIDIISIDNKDLITINIEYKTVEFNKKLTFPFSIPNGYKEITLK